MFCPSNHFQNTFYKWLTSDNFDDFISILFLLAGGKIDPLRALREEDPALIAKEEMRQVQDYFQDCEAQLNKVKAQKNSFQPGVWNCGTVLLGIKGSDPKRVQCGTSFQYLFNIFSISRLHDGLFPPL